MDCPKRYIKNNSMQQKEAKDALTAYIEKMTWTSNETVLDIGCGPGDVTSDLLYPFLKNKIKQLIGVDKSVEMVEYAKSTYGCSEMDFKVLDIENTNDCNSSYSSEFNKIFSFFCFHWIHNKVDSLLNMHTMLRSGGEILMNFLLVNPIVELYTFMDEEWQKYVKNTHQMLTNSPTEDELRVLFVNAGFRIINIESNVTKFTYPDFSSVLDAIRAVDETYCHMPQHLHDRYAKHTKEKILEKQIVEICPITGETALNYRPIIVHAAKD